MSGCHQILTGAVNHGDRSFSLGNIDGISFLAYASGCNIVILTFDFQRVQIIPGDVQICCVHCSSESGKIAAAYQNKIKIFEPNLTNQSDQNIVNPLFNYRWRETSTLECECRVNSLSWDQEGIRLLMGGTSLQMWKMTKKFVNDNQINTDNHHHKIQWECIWKCSTATEVHYLSFSPDSCLFATAGKFDRLVKIWYPITRYSTEPGKITYDFIFLAHPRAVTGFCWRQTSKYMPKGAVFNALITSCMDKICRIWTETVLPEDNLSMNMNTRDTQPNNINPKFHRTHKHKIMKRLQHVKACFHLRKHRYKDQFSTISAAIPLPFSTGAVPLIGAHASNVDFLHSHLNHGISVHFHLAGSINGETDVRLVPPLKHHNFRIFWLNNKEMFFTQQAEAILQEICQKGLDDESTENLDEIGKTKQGQGIPKSSSNDGSQTAGVGGGDDSSQQSNMSSAASSASLADYANSSFAPSIDILDRKLEALLRDWHKTPDILVSLHPIDGSFLVWSIEWLDEYNPGAFRQAQISFTTCIPGAIPLCPFSSSETLGISAENTIYHVPSIGTIPLSEKLASNRAGIMTKHHNGSLNLWTLSFGEDSKFCQVLSVAHAKRASGHRFQVQEMACHPVLPLILTSSQRYKHEQNDLDPIINPVDSSKQLLTQNYCSELILWRVDPIGPLCKSGGIVEIARINSTEPDAFVHVAWVPCLLPSTSLFSNSGCFVSFDGNNLRVYQAVLDASNLLTEISTAYRKRKASLNDSVVSLSSSSSLSSLNFNEGMEEPGNVDNIFPIVSQQSTTRPGCILQLDKIDSLVDLGEVSFIQVFRNDLDPTPRGNLDYRESFHVVLILNQHDCHVWRIEISTSLLVMDGTDEVFENINTYVNGDIALDIPGAKHTSTGEVVSENPKGKRSFLNISISKLLKQKLLTEIPNVIYSYCSGHLVCGSSYALISTTNESVKLWKLQRNPGVLSNNKKMDQVSFQEWNTLKSDIKDGILLQASSAYSGRIACVYKLKSSDVNDVLAESSCACSVYECESTGGSEWRLEDTIEMNVDDIIDAVHIEWITKHDAQHILALAISDMICLFAHVSNSPAMSFGAKSLPSTASCKSQFWLPLHAFKLSSADGLHPFPVRFSWIHAVCVVAMRNEMQVYSQWALENLTDVNSLIKAVPTKEVSEKKDLENLKGKNESIQISGGVGLFEYTRFCYPVLPQYHPRQLMEMLNSGKVRWVKVILAHLVRCLSGPNSGLKRQNSFQGDTTTEHDHRSRSLSRNRGLSVSYQLQTSPSPLEKRNSGVFQLEDVNLINSDIRSIPPVPLWMLLLESEKDKGGQPHSTEEKSKDYNELFNLDAVDDAIDESVFDDFGDDDDENDKNLRSRRRSTSGEANQPLSFGQRQSRMLSRFLTHTQLPGLSSVDQMYLLALADTVSSIGTRLDHHQSNANKTVHDGTPDSLDDCGLRFLLVVKHYSYLCRCLPPKQRVQVQKTGIATSDIVWAFHSESQEDILSLIPTYQKGEITWAQMRELGIGYWIRNNATLRTCVEKIAKWAYQKGNKNDPMDSAIFYLAMKKKTLVWGLYRSKRDDKMAAFFSNDFSQDRWRKAALKNAYALLGKQRFEHAASFFLLAGSLKDALEVCLAKLKDVQLALVIARLYDGGDIESTPTSVKTLLQEELINLKDEDPSDPFLRSIGLWMLKDYQQSLDTLLATPTVTTQIFNFYVFLRTHPLLVRQNKTRGTLTLSTKERNLYFQTAHTHYAEGCPALAIAVLSEVPKFIDKRSFSEAKDSSVTSPVKNQDDKKIESGLFDEHSWNTNNSIMDSKPAPVPLKKMTDSSMDFDWSTPVSLTTKKDDELDLNWDDEEENNEDEDEDKLDELKHDNHSKKHLKIGTQGSLLKDESFIDEGEEDLNNPNTMISVELKLASCLKLLSEELVNMAGQIEGTELRIHLYAWLEKQVLLLKEYCKYTSDEDDLTQDEWNIHDRSLTPKLDHSSGLHDMVISDKLDLEWKMGVLARRNRWLRANRHLLGTLLGFARLHAHSLAPVYIELVFLLDELQREKSIGNGPSLVSPLPLLNSEFPLLSAVANPNKTAVSYIQSSARDILHTICEMIAIPVLKNEDEEENNKGMVNAVVDDKKSDKGSVSKPTDVNEQQTGGVEIRIEEESSVEKDENKDTADDDKNIHNEDDDIDNISDRDSVDKTDAIVKRPEELSALVCDWRLVLVLRDSGISLSSCLFQALSDSEGNENSKDREIAAQLLYTPRRRRWSSSGEAAQGPRVTTTPDKWPGVAVLRGMLSREEDGETPKLKFLLVECYVSIFCSLFVHSIAICDAKILYRILSKKMDTAAFSSIFGGGAKRQIKISTMHQLHPQSQSIGSEKDPSGDTSPSTTVWTTLASLNKARMKFNMKLLGEQFKLSSQRSTSSTSTVKEERPTFREKFVPPEVSIYSYLMSKPKPRVDESDGRLIFQDSDDEEEGLNEEEEEEEDDDEIFGNKPKPQKVENVEDKPFSYSWRLIRLAAIKLAKAELERIVSIAGIEFTELSHVSPFLDGIIRVFSIWKDRLYKEMESVAPAPPYFLPNSTIENILGPPIHKYRALLEPTNTPFVLKSSTFSQRRLWNLLVREESVQNHFVRFVFGKKRAEDAISIWSEMCVDGSGRMKKESPSGGVVEENDDDNDSPSIGPIRIVHKEHESISAFCVNQSTSPHMAISTPKEIQELDVGVLLDMDSWKFEDQFEFDLMNLFKDPESLASSSYLVVQSPFDAMVPNLEKPHKGSHSLIKGVNFTGCENLQFVQHVQERSRRFMVPILKHRVDGTRRMASHQSRPLYLSGGQDGSVRLWEFSHASPVAIPRNPGTFAKVTRLRFHGSKFGVSDGDGRLSLFQIGPTPRPFFTIQCHTKQTSDFVFLGSSSLIGTAGTSSESKNVAMWDTLMPSRKAQIASFNCHEQGCVALCYAEEHQSLISAGKKGLICIWDVRQRSLRQRFQGHESAIKCMCLDPSEEFFCTGAADGDIKMWDFSGKLHAVFPGEHARSGFFKNIPGQGVTQISVDSSRRLFSCGSDGSVKIRVLVEKFE